MARQEKTRKERSWKNVRATTNLHENINCIVSNEEACLEFISQSETSVIVRGVGGGSDLIFVTRIFIYIS